MERNSNYLTNLFASFNDKYVIVKEHFKSEESYEVVLRVKLPTNESSSAACDEWKRQFSEKTNTNWIVKETFPHPTNYVYRKVYVCQHHSHNKSKQKSRKSERYTKYRNRNCEAKIDIKILKDTTDTRKKHKFIKEGLTTIIKVCFLRIK